MKEILLKDLSYRIIGAAIEVHKELGPGFPETIYQEALEKELTTRKIPFEPQKEIQIFYKGQQLSHNYFIDLVVDNKIVIELKALSQLVKDHESQTITYLRATNLKLALLINFGRSSLEHKRIINHHLQ